MASLRKILIPALLFGATLLTTLMAGALQQGVNPFASWKHLLAGAPFAISLLSILLTHELGHYLASRRHGIATSLPYFIPAPSLIGTFGAFIRTESPILYKRALFDIGVAGPLAGFGVSVVAIVEGLERSEVVREIPEGSISLGSPLLFSLLSRLVVGSLPEGADILLHPIAFAGWIGLFLTAMNLLPAGQLDGGHIAYAVFGPAHAIISRTTALVLMGMGVISWHGWLIWGVLILLLGLGHPPLVDQDAPLDGTRRWVAWLTLVVFIVCFVPEPFSSF